MGCYSRVCLGLLQQQDLLWAAATAGFTLDSSSLISCNHSSYLVHQLDLFIGEDGVPPGFIDCDVVVHPPGWAFERISILSTN